MNKAWQENPTVKELRSFGVTVGAVFVLLGGLMYWRNPNRVSPMWFVGIGATLAVLGLLAPKLLKLVYQVWMAFAFYLGRVMTNVLLTVFYIVGFGIISLILRVVGKDPLDRKWTPGASTYWRDRDVMSREGRDLKPY